MNWHIYIGIALALSAVFVVLSKHRQSLSQKILIIWLVFLALPLLSKVLRLHVPELAVILSPVYIPYPLSTGPFSWLYVQSLTGGIRRLRMYHLCHFLPFLLVALLPFLFGETFRPSEPGPMQVPKNPMHIDVINIVVHLGYSAAIFWRLGRHRFEMLQRFSVLSTQITLKWLSWLTFGFVITYMLPLSASLFSLPIELRSHDVVLVAFISILSFFGLKQTQEFHQTEGADDSATAQEVNPPTPEQDKSLSKTEHTNLPHMEAAVTISAKRQPTQSNKYEHSGLTDEKAQDYLKRLEAHMHKERPYLDANLTVDKLAVPLNIPKHHLTQILNELLNKNFYLFINEYRILTAQQLLREPLCKGMTVLEIAYKSGFNSKSTFNTTFKKITHMTPSQYRKSDVQSPKNTLGRTNL